MSPFKVLGITKYSSEDEIRIAYKRLLMKHHPDTGDGDRQKLDDIRQAFTDIKKIQSDSGSIITVTLNVKVSEEELEAQQKLEDDLVQKAIDGDTSEDATSALLGYNPNFREYVQPQMKVQAQWYTSDGIYELQQNYDNPNQRFFNGASDVKHREMVRQQYGEK